MKKILLTSLIAITTLFINAQCLIKHVPLHTKISNATLVVEGKVISKTSFWDASHQKIYTSNKIEIFKIFKGVVPGSYLEVITEGGTVGMDMLVVEPSLILNEEQVGVFSLKPTNVNVPISATSGLPIFDVYASLQGFIKYDLNNLTASAPFENFSNISTVLYPSINAITHQTYQTVKKVNFQSVSQNQIQVGHSISNINPTSLTSGTKTQLTITGSGFGATRGTSKVEFANADDGGATTIAPLAKDYISWSDNTIIVEVPTKAGTGTVDVVVGATPATSGQTLTVNWARLNRIFDPSSGDSAYFTTHINHNGSGGYTFRMETDFDGNASAKASFIRAMDEWRCNSGFNISVGAVTTTDAVLSDGINVVRFDDGAELPVGVLGVCSSWRSGCGSPGSPAVFYVSGLDITFDDATNWQFGPSLPGVTEYDFESVAVHELGHGHQLGHVISPGAIMHYAISNGSSNRDLGVNDLAGGNAIQAQSKVTAPCAQGAASDYSCSATPVANFSGDQTTICSGSNVTFSDLSSNTPTSWSWAFEGGTPSTSTIQNPVVTYNSNGLYSVTLVATNASGSDVKVETGYISVGCPELQGPYCPTTLTTLDDVIYCTNITGASNYRYRVTNAGLGYSAVYYRNSRFNYFHLRWVGGIQYNQTYDVEVSAYVNGQWSDYGNACAVTTPAATPTTQLEGASCGASVSSLDDVLYCVAVPGATNYRYRVTHALSGYSSVYYRKARFNDFRIRWAGGIQHGLTYDVEVSSYVGGVWSNYGNVCTVTTPAAVPTTQLTGPYCPATLPSLYSYIYIDKVPGATDYEYRFQHSGSGFSTTRRRKNRFTYLYTGWVAGLQNGLTYDVDVRAYVGGVWGNYGPVCQVTMPAAGIIANPGSVNPDGGLTQVYSNGNDGVIEDHRNGTTNNSLDFDANIYPNPTNTGDVFLSINSPIDGMATIQLTDIMGRHIFAENVSLSEGGNVIKQNYSILGVEKGIYLITISSNNGDYKIVKRLIIE